MKPYYESGGITIYHGDCRDVLPTLEPVDLVLTDPPYGIALSEHGRNCHDWHVAGDHNQELGQSVLDNLDYPQVAFSHPKKPWSGDWRQYLVWDKGPTVGGGGDRATCWKFSFELIQVRRTPQLKGKRDEAVLRFHINQRDYALHPCQKPTKLVRYLLKKIPAQTILDPFMGSGTTLRAAKDLGRRAIGIELEERYCEIAAERLRQGVLFT